MRQIAVIGLGRFGFSVVETLSQKGYEVLAIDKDEEKIDSVSDMATYAVQCDATDLKALTSVSIQNVDVVVVSIGEDIEASILIVMTLKELGIPQVFAKAVTPLHGRILVNLGVTEVIFPERDVAIRLAHRLITPQVKEYMQLSPGFSVEEISVPPRMIGKLLKESEISTIYGLDVIAIRKKIARVDKGIVKKEEVLNRNPSPDEILEKGDVLVIVGREEDLDRLSKLE